MFVAIDLISLVNYQQVLKYGKYNTVFLSTTTTTAAASSTSVFHVVKVDRNAAAGDGIALQLLNGGSLPSREGREEVHAANPVVSRVP